MRQTPPILLTFLLLALFLTSCTSAPPVSYADTPALFSDADIDAASLVATEALELQTTDLEPLPPLAEVSEFQPGNLTVQRNPNEGFVAYIIHAPDLTNPWFLFRRDMRTGSNTPIYSGTREISSVGITGDGNTMVFTMRASAASNSPFEVYRLTISTRRIEQLTYTSASESDVSISYGGHSIVWEGANLFGTRRTVYLRRDANTMTLPNIVGYDNVQPSLSGDGRFIALVRHPLQAGANH